MSWNYFCQRLNIVAIVSEECVLLYCSQSLVLIHVSEHGVVSILYHLFDKTGETLLHFII